MDEKLDLTVFSKAIKTFKEALDEYAKDETNTFVRDSCIQRFEYCYDLSKKFLKRHLKNTSDDPSEIEEMKLESQIRLGAKKGILLNSWDIWDNYRNNRNQTSHGYDEAIAKKISEEIHAFLVESEYLLDKLKAYYEA